MKRKRRNLIIISILLSMAGAVLLHRVFPGDFTDSGHFIVVTDTRAEEVFIVDPNSHALTRWWDWEKILNQSKNMWVFYPAEVL